VEEPVPLQPDVDERRLHAGQHVVHDALVDVADDRPLAAALDVELGDLEGVIAVGPARCFPAIGPGRALALENRDAGLAGVD